MEPSQHEDWIASAVERFGRPLTHYAWGLLGDADRARDVVQDTFVRLCGQRREKLDSRLGPWLFTVCRNRALDVLRKESRMTPLTASQDAALAAEPEAGPEGPPCGSLADALAVLPPQQREAIRLKFLHEMSYREISRITGLSESHVGVLIHNGLKTLRRRFAGAHAERSLA